MKKNKMYYVNLYNKVVDEYYQEYVKEVGNDNNFDSMEIIDTPELIVGYYLITYNDDALEIWEKNLLLAKWKHKTDKEVTKILKEIE